MDKFKSSIAARRSNEPQAPPVKEIDVELEFEDEEERKSEASETKAGKRKEVIVITDKNFEDAGGSQRTSQPQKQQ